MRTVTDTTVKHLRGHGFLLNRHFFKNTIILFIVPHAFGILIVSILPCLCNSSSMNPLLPSEFRKAVCDMVWIFWNCPLFQASQFRKFHAKQESQPGLSIRASRWPKPLASQPSLACYFHLLLPQLITKKSTMK